MHFAMMDNVHRFNAIMIEYAFGVIHFSVAPLLLLFSLLLPPQCSVHRLLLQLKAFYFLFLDFLRDIHKPWIDHIVFRNRL